LKPIEYGSAVTIRCGHRNVRSKCSTMLHDCELIGVTDQDRWCNYWCCTFYNWPAGASSRSVASGTFLTQEDLRTSSLPAMNRRTQGLEVGG